MLLKRADDKRVHIETLLTLRALATDARQQETITRELRILRAGIRGELRG